MATKQIAPEPVVAPEPTTVVVEVPRRSPWGIAAGLAAAAIVGALAFGGGVLLGANLPGQGGPQGVTFQIPDGGVQQFGPQQRQP
jgi:hypothetical protein